MSSRAGQPGGPNRTALLQRELEVYSARHSPARRVQPPFERYKRTLPQELEDAARLLLRDFLLATSVPETTDRALVPRDVRDAQTTVAMIRAEWPPDFVRDVESFVAQVVHRADGTPRRLEDSGAEMFPGKSKDAQRWAGAGGLFRVLQLASRWYGRQRALGKPGEEPSTADKQVLAERLKVLARQRRERDSPRE